MRGTCRPRSSRHSASWSGQLDPERLVTASFGGHDLDEADLREALLTIGLDFVAPHRPRDAGSAGQTEARTRECLATMRGDRPVGPGALPGAVPPGLRPLAADGERLPHRPARRRGRRGRRVVPPQRLQPRGPGGASATLVRPPRPAPVRPARRGGAGGRRPGRGGDASGAASEGSRVPAPFRLARPALGPRPGGLRPHRPGGPGPRRRPRLRLRRPHPAARATLLVRVPRARRLGPA